MSKEKTLRQKKREIRKQQDRISAIEANLGVARATLNSMLNDYKYAKAKFKVGDTVTIPDSKWPSTVWVVKAIDMRRIKNLILHYILETQNGSNPGGGTRTIITEEHLKLYIPKSREDKHDG